MTFNNPLKRSQNLDAFYAKEDALIKQLQVVLSKELVREVSYDEAKATLRSLTAYYETLADGKLITNTGLERYAN